MLERNQFEEPIFASTSRSAPFLSTLLQGYVKSCSPKGCFVTLGPNIDARILMANLSTTFIDDPAKEFPPGKLVHGWCVPCSFHWPYYAVS